MSVKSEIPSLVQRCLTEGDPLATREVPALALALLGASMAETDRITDGLIDYHKEQASLWRARAEEAERGLEDVRALHAMLCEPQAARALCKLLGREMWLQRARSEEYAAHDADKGEV
jgi:hypothetical protein